MKRILLTAVVFVITAAFVTTSFAEGACTQSYTQYGLNQLGKKSGEKIKRLNRKIARTKKEGKARVDLDELNNLYARAEALYNQGKYEQAKYLYLHIKESSKDAIIRAAIRQRNKELKRLAERKLREEKRLRKEKLIEENAKRTAERKRQRELEEQKRAEEIAARRAARTRQVNLRKQRKAEKLAARKAEKARQKRLRKQKKAEKKAAKEAEEIKKKAARRAKREKEGAPIKLNY